MAVDRKAVADALARANAQTGLFRIGRGLAEIAEWDARDRCWRSTYWRAVDGMGARVTVLSARLTPPDEPEPVPPVSVRWNVPPGGDG